MYFKWAARGARLAKAQDQKTPVTRFSAAPHALGLTPSPRHPKSGSQEGQPKIIRAGQTPDHKVHSQAGALVEYVANGERCLGSLRYCCPHEDGWVVASKNNHEFTLPRNSVTFQWPSQYMGQIYQYRPEDIQPLENVCHSLIEKHADDLKIAWGNFVDKGIPVTSSETLAKFLFGTFPKPHESYVAYCILMDDELYFERIENSTSPEAIWKCRSLAEVLSLKKKQKAAVTQALKLETFLSKARAVLDGLVQGRKELWENENDQPFINHLIKYAVSKASEIDQMLSCKILTNLKFENAQAWDAFSFLVSIAIFTKYQNLNPLRFGRDLHLSPKDLRRYTSLLSRYPDGFPDHDAKFRKDLRGPLPTIAIDEADAHEIDDGLGIQFREDGSTWVCVHIADPSSMIKPNDELDFIARKRGSSIFLPESNYSMLPTEMVNYFNIQPNKTNLSLSFLIKLGSDGSVEDYEIVPSLIDKVHRLTYTQADTLLNEQTDEDDTQTVLSTLHNLYKIRTAYRQKGQTSFELPSPDIFVKGEGEYIQVVRVDHQKSPTRLMVAEFMILAGDICADFAIKHNISIPFRGQDKKSAPPVSSYDHELALQANGYQHPEFSKWIDNMMNSWTERQLLQPATCATKPTPHLSLGLPAYCQVTSPIRRYSDLLVHYQIKATLRGEKTPFSEPQISELISEMDKSQIEINQLVHHSQRYWMLRYFERQSSDLFFVLVLSIQSSYGGQTNMQVLFLDLGYRMTVSLARTPVVGETIHLMVESADAFHNKISFVECPGLKDL